LAAAPSSIGARRANRLTAGAITWENAQAWIDVVAAQS
jgi:hypothetical protein